MKLAFYTYRLPARLSKWFFCPPSEVCPPPAAPSWLHRERSIPSSAVHFADRDAVPPPVHEVDLMNVFSAAIDLLFADPNLARDAAYAPADGDTLPVRIIARRPDSVTDFVDARLWSETASFDVRVSEVALPRPGDRLILDGEIFVIQGEPLRDAERLIWTIEARAQ